MMPFTFGTVCSGIDAAALAFQGLGDHRFAAEIDPYCCALLAVRYGATIPLRLPKDYSARAVARLKVFRHWGDRVPNLGDLLQITPDDLPPVELLVSGTPCQDFSQAGTRAGLGGPNGQLTLRFLELAHGLVDRGLRAVLWENVPRVLTAAGNPFGTILGRLIGSDTPIDNPWYGGRWPRAGVAVGPQGSAAWRVLDAQHFGLAQRRERLFVVAGVGPAGVDPVAVLFERRDMQAAHPRRDTGAEDHADDLLAGCWPPIAYTLRTRATGPVPEVETGEVFPTLRASAGGSTRPFVVTPEGVRRLTPGEGETIMGFPRDFTAIQWPPRANAKRMDDSIPAGYGFDPGVQLLPASQGVASPGLRLAALGNSKPVPILRYLGAALAREFAKVPQLQETDPHDGQSTETVFHV